MQLPAGLRLGFEDNPSWADRELIDEALGAYNAPYLRDSRYSYFGLLVREDSGAIRAGLIGHCYAGWLFVALLWVHADLRRSGIGRGLMAEAERHALEFGCQGGMGRAAGRPERFVLRRLPRIVDRGLAQAARTMDRMTPPPSFPRMRESRGRNNVACPWTPAFAGATTIWMPHA